MKFYGFYYQHEVMNNVTHLAFRFFFSFYRICFLISDTVNAETYTDQA